MVKFAIGQAVSRLEDEPLLKGAGRYADDVNVANLAHAYILRSPHAHARIARLDASAAKKAPGVLAVLTGKDVEADGLGDMPCLVPIQSIDGSQRADTPRPILATELVRHVGDAVALVVAQTLHQARDAAELIDIDYEERPAAVHTVGATKEGAPLAWDHIKRNLCFDWENGEKAKVEAAIKAAAHVTKVELWNNRCVVNSMEPRSAIADYDAASDRSTLYTSSQGPTLIHPQIAETVLKISKQKLRCVTPNVGGAFGMKIFLYAEQCLIVWASRKVKRAVRWVAERSEAFLSDTQGRDNYSIAELALDKDARILGLRVTTYANLGAYLSNFGPFIPTYGTVMLAGVYKTPAIYINVKGVMTNTVPVDAYRGAGRPEAIYLVERTLDAAARELGIEPDEIRRRNFIQPTEMPYKTTLGDLYDSGDFPAVMQASMTRADWKGFPARRAEAAKRGKLRGIGMAYYIEKCGNGPSETAIVKVDPAGTVTLLLGMQDNGQGHATAHTQILSQKLGIDPSKIKVIQGDTDLTPTGMTGGSRFAATGGVAVITAADQVIDKGKAVAANAMEVAASDIEYADGTFTVAGTDKNISLFEAAAAAKDPAKLPKGMAPGLDVEHTETLACATYPNGCHIVEVEVDRDTGRVGIVRYTAVDDFGSVINPNMLAGQVHGGIAQGVGQALLEHTVYDGENGQLLSASFMDYAIPRADDVPSFDVSVHNVPCTTNVLGIKGAGEAGAIGAPPAVINAIVDAIYPACGVTHIDMPAIPEKVWRALQNAKPAKAA
jgi:aerobic carbon-monoxide dehydrogenase large subunit